jgi:hypothetical protein
MVNKTLREMNPEVYSTPASGLNTLLSVSISHHAYHDRVTSQVVRCRVQTRDGSAVAGRDFVGKEEIVEWGAYETAKAFSVTLLRRKVCLRLSRVD